MNVTVVETVRINAPAETVFDFTQDWTKRPLWDATVLGAEALDGEERSYKVRGAGSLSFTARYKLFRRPERTSLAMTDISSPLFTGGGGSWDYTADGGATAWTQTNTLSLPDGPLGWLLAPFMRLVLSRSTRKAMLAAKALLERDAA